MPLSWLRVMGKGLGYITWLFKPRLVSHTQDNIAHCLPELSQAQQQQLARASVQETLTTVLEAGYIWRSSWDALCKKILTREGEEILRTQLAAGKGLVVVVPHIGAWELVGPYLASLGPLTAMYKPLKYPNLDKLVFTGRSKLSTAMVPASRRGVVQLLKALEAGGLVIVLADHVPNEQAGKQLAPFFNQPAWTMTLVQGLVKRTGCAVCSCFAERIAGGYSTRILNTDERIYSKDPEVSTIGLNAGIEACIRLVPTQYQWGYKRFRNLPEPLANIYRR